MFTYGEPVSFFVTPQTEIMFSRQGEFIFSASGKKLVSYLEWQTSPLVYAGLEAGLDTPAGIFRTDADIAIPADCGKMYDSDWNYSGVKTTYSIHQNHAELNYKLSAGYSYPFSLKSFKIEPGVSFLYTHDFFHAHDGYGWYGGENYSKNGVDNSWDSEFARKAKKLYPIDFKRTTYFAFAGIDFSWLPVDSFSLNLGFAVSAYTNSHTQDCHFGKPGTQNDFILNETQESFFDRFQTHLSVDWQFRKNLSFFASANWLYGGLVKGLLYDDDVLVTQPSGSTINSLSVKTGIKIFIF